MVKMRTANFVFYVLIGILLAVLGVNRYHHAQNDRLIEAVLKNDEAAVLNLIRRGADPNATRFEDGYIHSRAYVLIDAIQEKESLAIVQALLARGANPNPPLSVGAPSPLNKAILVRRADILRLLLEKGAHSGASDTKSPTHLAAQYDSPDCYRLLRQYGYPATLEDAIRFGDSVTVKTLLDQGEDINQKDASGATPLFWALTYRQDAIAKLLVARGADVSQVPQYASRLKAALNTTQQSGKSDREIAAPLKTKEEQTGLSKAILAKNVQAVRDQIREGADVNHIPIDSAPMSAFNVKTPRPEQAPLFLAVESQNPEIVHLLLEAGANVHLRIGYAQTLLMYAAMRGNSDIVRALILKGASINDADDHWLTAVKYAIRQNHPDAYRVLKEHGAQIDLCDATTMGDVEMIRRLVQQGANVNRANREGNLPLTLAAMRGQIPTMQVLLELGANIEGTNPQGETALMKVVWTEHTDCVRFLLDRGANPNAVHSNGKTALIRAAEAGRLDVLRLLLQKGADVHVRSDKGDTALKMAEQHGHADAATLLRQFGAQE